MEHERNWLFDELGDSYNLEMHQGLLSETIAQVMRGNSSDLEYLLKHMQGRSGMNQNLIWEVALKAFTNDERVIDSVCKLLQSEQYFFPLGLRSGDVDILNI